VLSQLNVYFKLLEIIKLHIIYARKFYMRDQEEVDITFHIEEELHKIFFILLMIKASLQGIQ
jgi:hypothetical protein